MKQNIILPLVVGVLVFAGGAYYFATLDDAPTTQTNIPTPIQQTPTPLSAQTANGKYTNDKFGFEISADGMIAETKTYSVAFTEKTPCKNATRCRFGIIEVAKTDAAHPSLQSIKADGQNYLVTWGQDSTIGGQVAIRGISNEASGNSLAYVIYKGNLYTFVGADILDPKVLSTFKFTN